MIELRLIGRVSLTGVEGREVRNLLGQPRRLALLAFLAAATPRGFHRRDSLLPLFWPELDQEHARAALRQALHVLRANLGAETVPSRGNEEVLVRRLITLLDRHGDRAGALEAYEEFAVRLREEYDAQPAAETQDLIAAVRARERAAGPAPRLSMDVLARLRAGLADRYRV